MLYCYFGASQTLLILMELLQKCHTNETFSMYIINLCLAFAVLTYTCDTWYKRNLYIVVSLAK